MSTLSDRAAAALVRRQKAAWGVSVTYTRSATTLTLTVVPGQAVAISQELPGRIEIAERDYLVAVADLTLGEPAIGDRITETIGGVPCVFEVMQPKTGEPAWRYSSQWRVLYRLHCKRVDA